jgi:hypothetical protein
MAEEKSKAAHVFQSMDRMRSVVLRFGKEKLLDTIGTIPMWESWKMTRLRLVEKVAQLLGEKEALNAGWCESVDWKFVPGNSEVKLNSENVGATRTNSPAWLGTTERGRRPMSRMHRVVG